MTDSTSALSGGYKVTDLRQFRKAPPPKLGEAFSDTWSSGLMQWNRLPGGGVVQFNLDKLTMQDFRNMIDHYQVNASLSVLKFMMHQLDWRIECDSEKVRTLCQENMAKMWTRLVRALSQAFWAGYSPCILQWENDLPGRRVELTKIKDLVPELCEVNWADVEGWAPPGYSKPKIKVYDGIKQYGMQWPIPRENTLWYTLLMENGNYYGRKLLRPAFTSWYFSILMHMFSNRYFERFGEPLPIGRAPYDKVTKPDGTQTTGLAIMGEILQNLRSRGVVVLPDDKTQRGNDVTYDYTIEYLESQMRGADFERYLMRLDEEISLALFTPLLILRTADVGSYNLGTGHWNVYQQMLNALAGDWAEYINRYILSPMTDYNFGTNAPRPSIKFRKLGDDKQQLANTLLQALISGRQAMPDLVELGQIAGLTIREVEELSAPPEPIPSEDPEDDTDDDSGGEKASPPRSDNQRRRGLDNIRQAIVDRVAGQLERARREGAAQFAPDLGHRRQLIGEIGATHSSDVEEALSITAGWLTEAYAAGTEDLIDGLHRTLGRQLARFARE